MQLFADIQKLQRHFIPDGFVISTWEELEPYVKL